MTTLHLSVINDGRTYGDRVRVMRSSMTRAAKYRAISRLVCAQADAEKASFDTDYTYDDISQATLEVLAYMERHIAELDDGWTHVRGLERRS